MARAVCWFSCGAASAVAAKLALTAKDRPEDVDEIVVVNCEVVEEHPDNRRFLRDCEEWFGVPITVLGNDKYGRSAHRVFRETRFLVGPSGARCTGELKRALRHEHQRPDDVIVMGFTSEEAHRQERFAASEWPMRTWPILIERDLHKADCHAILAQAGIREPEMYRLGYKNANCIGCVKGQAGYWNKVRVDFPDVFAEMARIERELGRQICKREWTESGVRKQERIYLDELPPGLGTYEADAPSECGLFCQMAVQDMEVA